MKTNDFVQKYGQWAIITGASSGLGAEFAIQLAKRGLHLVLVARREERLKNLAEHLNREYGVLTRCVALDLTNPEALSILLRETHNLEIGLLVNNAGFTRTQEFCQSTVENEETIYRLNCIIPMQLALEYGKRMAARGSGGIIFVSSSVAYSSVPYWTHYSATKAYLLHLGEGLYYEMKKCGVDVITVCPGGMKTEFQSIAGISDIGAMDVKPVAICTLKALGKKPSVIPGWYNSILYKMLPKFLPVKWRLALFGWIIMKLSIKS